MKGNRGVVLAILASVAGGASAQDDVARARLPFEGTVTVASTIPQVDATCILRTWRVKGVMVCPQNGHLKPCLWIENAYPCGLFEVVRQSTKSHLAELAGFKAFENLKPYGKTSSHTGDSGDETHLEFAEAHVFTFVPPIIPGDDFSEIPIAKPSGPLFQVSYLTELDGFFWRNGLAEWLVEPVAMAKRALLPACSTLPELVTCAGKWGSYYPRIGFLNHPSQVMAAHVQALRAGRAAARPMGRAVLSPYPFEPRTGHYLQLVRPALRACAPIGFPFTKLIETGAGSRFGAYLFVHFGVFETCKGCMPVILTEARVPVGP